uniref:Uncharacterized protein LOC111136692 isoform X1 n=1 Tax=Crassostrea virginica TaxID=6565 RepID=A0A8B8EU67_CRAVI|nr:uncharacterized protein LOC111136692 isoform X1 [Crassostrea virginica]
MSLSARSHRDGRISVVSAELYGLLRDPTPEGTSSTHTTGGRRTLEHRTEGIPTLPQQGPWIGKEEKHLKIANSRPSSTALLRLPPIGDKEEYSAMAEFTIGNRSKSFPFKKDLPVSTNSVRKLNAKSLEKELLSQFKSRRLHPHFHVQMGMNKSPRQRLSQAFYPSASQLAAQSIDQIQHHAHADAAPAITCAADDRLVADVMGSSDMTNDGINVEDHHYHDSVTASSQAETKVKSRGHFKGTSSHDGHLGENQLPTPRWRNSNDASDSAFYSMTKKPRGYAVIINNYEFYKEMMAITNSGPQTLRVIQKGLRRDGSIEDTDKLARFFRDELHFIVRGYSNVPAYDMIQLLSDVSNSDHAQFDAFVCCIASHGRRGTLFGSDCREIKVNDVTDLFNGNRCVSLSGKPKCFFIQGCRGDHFSLKGILSGPRKAPRDESFIPMTCDFMLAYSMVKTARNITRDKAEVFYTRLSKDTSGNTHRDTISSTSWFV